MTKGRGHRGVKGPAGSYEVISHDSHSEIRNRQPDLDDPDLPPTQVRHHRPPTRSMLEDLDPPTGLHELGAPGAFRAPSDPNDDLTRVKSPSKLLEELEKAAVVADAKTRNIDEADIAPTRVRRTGRGVPSVRPPAPDGSPSQRPPADSDPPPDSDPIGLEGPHSLQGLKVGRSCQMGPAFARGGMATVHLGRWYGAGGFAKTVAIKRLHRQFATDPDFVSMLLDEARVVARIRHGNVAAVMDVIEQDDELFIVMDYVHGVTLAQLMRQLKRKGEMMPIPIAMRIASGILHGLQAAHDATDEHGNSLCLIHRDVSPENVIVGCDGYAQLIDFGIARAVGRSTKSADGQIKGKLRYCSPEQLRGAPLEPSSDIYAASIVLWEMTCGRRLYRGENAGALVYEILNSEVTHPSSLRDGLSEAYDEIVLQGLDADKDRRWLTAADMAEALERSVPKASHREVGDWVKATAPDKLATLSSKLKQVETLPPIEVEGPAVALRPVPVTSSPAPAPKRVLWVAAATAFALGALGLGVAIGGNDRDEPPPPTATETAAPPTKTVFVPVPVPAPVPPALEVTPSVSAPPPSSASAAPSSFPVPKGGRPSFPRPRPKPKVWIPDGI